ncbi:S8 family serine peptidase [Bacillus sp. D386]|uniref:S8 family peptidase n=1 Tax=Bacillus sp. D386 TaxID=2587155 RepID=UPI0015D5836A|nr:S8 family serine peptidase [Bacillus sp. D386]
MYESSKALNDAVQAAYKKDVLIVAAAGNDQTTRPTFPAALQNVLSVSSTTKFDKKSYFSNYGTSIDLAAPGSEITSTLPNNKSGSMSGTSMASPIVAGAAALILSKEPKLTNEQVAYRLVSTADDLGEKGKDTSYGTGRINVANALKYRLLATPVVSQLTDKDKAIRIQYKEAFKGKVIITGKTKVEMKISSDRAFNSVD